MGTNDQIGSTLKLLAASAKQAQELFPGTPYASALQKISIEAHAQMGEVPPPVTSSIANPQSQTTWQGKSAPNVTSPANKIAPFAPQAKTLAPQVPEAPSTTPVSNAQAAASQDQALNPETYLDPNEYANAYKSVELLTSTDIQELAALQEEQFKQEARLAAWQREQALTAAGPKIGPKVTKAKKSPHSMSNLSVSKPAKASARDVKPADQKQDKVAVLAPVPKGSPARGIPIKGATRKLKQPSDEQTLIHRFYEVLTKKPGLKNDTKMCAKLAETIVLDARKLKLEPLLILAQIQQESDFNPLAVSSVGARGLMQLRPQAVQDVIANYPDMKGVTWAQVCADPVINVKTGIRYLALLNKLVQGYAELSLIAYNIGPTKLQGYLNGAKIGLGNEHLFRRPPPGPLSQLADKLDSRVDSVITQMPDLAHARVTYANRIARFVDKLAVQTQTEFEEIKW